MSTTTQNVNTITIPARLFERFLERSESLLDIYAEVEDFYISHNPQLIEKLREAHRQHLSGDLVTFETLKARYVSD